MQPWILDLLSTCAEIERLLQLLTDFPGELWSYKKKGIAVMIKDVSRCRHHSRGIFHFSSNRWNLSKQICHYISEPRGVWLCNNNAPLVFLCSMSIKKNELSHPAKREYVVKYWKKKTLNQWRTSGMITEWAIFFSKTTLLTLTFTEKGRHDTGWAFDLVPGAPGQSERESNTHNKVLICTSMLDHADLLVQHSWYIFTIYQSCRVMKDQCYFALMIHYWI